MNAGDPARAMPGAGFAETGCWRIRDDRDITTAREGLARDVDLGHAVARGASPTFRLWQTDPALVVSRQDMRLPHIARAIEYTGNAGWPVVARETGGSAVAMGPGVLNLSLLLPRSLVTGASGYAMDTVYHLLCEPIRQALSTIGIPTRYGSVPGAFCDGRFNLVTGGKKIAGTAQASRANIARRGTDREGYVLAHAAVLVDIDARCLTNMVNRFYEIAGGTERFSDRDVTSVRHCLASVGDGESRTGVATLVDDMRARILSGIRTPKRDRSNVVL